MKTVEEVIDRVPGMLCDRFVIPDWKRDQVQSELRELINSLLEELAIRIEELKVYSEREPGYDRDYNTALDNAVLNIRAAKSLPTNKSK